MSAENKTIVRRVFEELWNRGNLSVADEVYAANHIRHDPILPAQGPEGEKGVVAAVRAAVPDVTFKVDDLTAESDLASCRWTSRGTHSGELMGVPPTGKTIGGTGQVILRFSGGKIVEAWVNWDALGMLQQMGVTVSPAAESNKAVVRRVIEEGWNQRKSAAMEELIAPDAVAFRPDGELHGREAMMRMYAAYFTAMPDCRLVIDDLTAEGDQVTVRWRCLGTQTGDLMGIPASGRPVTVKGLSIFRLAGGKITSAHEAWDTLSTLQQIGAAPAAARAVAQAAG